MSTDSKVIPFPQRPHFVLELHSERMIDCIHALIAAGFTVTYIKNTFPNDRYRIEDEQELK